MARLTKTLLAVLLFGGTTLGAACAQTETYPNRPIQVLIPFAGGSASDVISRIMLDRMSKSLGQQFVERRQVAVAAVRNLHRHDRRRDDARGV